MELQRSTVLDPAEWSRALAALPDAHVLQTWEWGEFKAGYGWSAERLVWRTVDGRPAAAAQVLERRRARSRARSVEQRALLPAWPAARLARRRSRRPRAARPACHGRTSRRAANQDRPRPAPRARLGRQRRVRRESHRDRPGRQTPGQSATAHRPSRSSSAIPSSSTWDPERIACSPA